MAYRLFKSVSGITLTVYIYVIFSAYGLRSATSTISPTREMPSLLHSSRPISQLELQRTLRQQAAEMARELRQQAAERRDAAQELQRTLRQQAAEMARELRQQAAERRDAAQELQRTAGDSHSRVYNQCNFNQSTAPGVCSVETFTRCTYGPENGWSYYHATRINCSHCPHCECGGPSEAGCRPTDQNSEEANHSTV